MDTTIPYGYERTTAKSFDQALSEARVQLKAQGFGVLCEIDVAKTLKEKIGVEFRGYVILGACNPQLAYRALSAEAQLGLLLPCNVVVQERNGETIVSAIDAMKLLSVVGRPELEPVAEEVNARLKTAVDATTA